ncbi:DUF551 domain-containing protein [Hymenobacter psychrophilus]|uniref:DUF551 domain-containing protein n=1 Tax=Hymenobacter psychrophilus TaxID=651662 RepID=A0A1H3PA67_9BACT|nr:DUF551 domain-containing protein [Hymenobacter psychrophilus]SDY97981.1 Protein of unknown function [Hymenobacter psychrophilus]
MGRIEKLMEQNQNEAMTPAKLEALQQIKALAEQHAGGYRNEPESFNQFERTAFLDGFCRGYQEATPPATPAPEAAGEAGERWEVRQAREVLAVANRPDADPSARFGYAGVLASCMTGVLQELDALTARLHAAQATAEAEGARAAGWVPVGERLPETRAGSHPVFTMYNSDAVLVVEDGKTAGSLGYCNDKGEWFLLGAGGYPVTGITHWQPLPTPPTP